MLQGKIQPMLFFLLFVGLISTLRVPQTYIHLVSIQTDIYTSIINRQPHV